VVAVSLPAIKISHSALKKLDYLVLNALEASQMAEQLGLKGDSDAMKLAQALAQFGNLTCIITQGEHGSLAVTDKNVQYRVPALKLDDLIDHTGAGDAYCGTLAACLHNVMGLQKAMKYASVAGSLACRKQGAQNSYAYLSEIEDHLALLDD